MEETLMEEQTLIFKQFTNIDALKVGNMLAQVAIQKQYPIVIDISLTDRPLFYYANTNTNADKQNWVRRKKNTCLRMGNSTKFLGLKFDQNLKGFCDMYGLDQKDHMIGCGSFPIVLEGFGLIGAISVAGLKGNMDHEVIVNVLKEYLNK